MERVGMVKNLQDRQGSCVRGGVSGIPPARQAVQGLFNTQGCHKEPAESKERQPQTFPVPSSAAPVSGPVSPCPFTPSVCSRGYLLLYKRINGANLKAYPEIPLEVDFFFPFNKDEAFI